ncbi:16S rRNA (cytidine(1402)-2'-O)-methyltransferase [Candidatus Curtissbacteria bacterium RIFCSPHIGHO2_12_FULL_38_9b]|uniref:Ribosomal RNA small subunit methyltransferase I n=1 Tax=Candidatus Curtissbacteria bacterium RIFCSPHIGHO2_12_FULL_38_9b TaxID=1797720 RepID=A0A1F5GWA6_9BACT|nr:MAG: 16S rRNA (cytidine(1402)-2'-O)-methyltransferase [Candidatus Curtissbacteria bacterium RIFCSPHIGHO2_12_FULL_38_9b]
MGTLFIVATPIGNLKDITLRALETLKKVDSVICEDTRITGKLLNYYGIKKTMISLNEFNEKAKTAQIISILKSNKDLALISDAGTPLVSDPGFYLVNEAIKNNIVLESIPGSTALICAITLSGYSGQNFYFAGFMPKKSMKRELFLKNILLLRKKLKFTIVAYESPYRLIKTLNNIQGLGGNIKIAICREMTKLHQEIRRENINSSIAHFLKNKPRGEFTIIF